MGWRNVGRRAIAAQGGCHGAGPAPLPHHARGAKLRCAQVGSQGEVNEGRQQQRRGGGAGAQPSLACRWAGGAREEAARHCREGLERREGPPLERRRRWRHGAPCPRPALQQLAQQLGPRARRPGRRNHAQGPRSGGRQGGAQKRNSGSQSMDHKNLVSSDLLNTRSMGTSLRLHLRGTREAVVHAACSWPWSCCRKPSPCRSQAAVAAAVAAAAAPCCACFHAPAHHATVMRGSR